MNWHGSDIQEILQGNAGSVAWQASGISIDSRTIKAGEVFIALRGDFFDGHDYISQALDNGASAIIAEQFYPTPEGVGLIEVHDSLQALQAIAETARSRMNCKVIGITGSVGKTTTKEMLLQAFSAFGKCHATHGNFNNHIGLPLVLVNAPDDLDFLILEMGMNHKCEIEFLTKLGKPDLAIITNVKAAHMMNFANIEEVASAKSEIFLSAPQQALILGDDEKITPLLFEAAVSAGVEDIKKFGINHNVLTELCDYKLLDFATSLPPKISASFEGKPVKYSIGMLGGHAASNSLIALAAVDMINGSCDFSALQNFTAPKGRGALSQINLRSNGTAVVIDESYNASPSAVLASLQLLADVKNLHQGKRSVAVLGDMMELGKNEIQYHTDIASDLQANAIDKLICVGQRMKHLYNVVPESMRIQAYATTEELLSDIWNCLENDDIILLKGSHSVGLDKIVQHLQEA